MTSPSNTQIDASLEHTLRRPASLRPPTKNVRRNFTLTFKAWAGSQVAAYRVGLVLGYMAMIFFGGSAFIAGIPVFEFTTPNPSTWIPIWSALVVVGGFVAGVGSLKAGTEPVTKSIKRYNAIELTGAVILFLTLTIYAGTLLYIGYVYHDNGRASVGAGFVALGVHPTVRMFWLIFRPRVLSMAARFGLHTGPVIMVPPGHALFTVDADGKPLVAVATAPEPDKGPEHV